MEISLVDDNGAEVPHGEAGEMLVKGPGVSAGYWIGPGQIDSASEDGWYRTGDLMCQAADSELWFVSRKKELIIRGGSNISPGEVEQVLLDHPAVRDAAVLGVADPKLGQRVAALGRLAKTADDADLSGIRDHVRAHLADYKVPEWIQVVTEIPRNALGKIERRALMDLLETDE